MRRREFLQRLGVGLGAAWLSQHLPWGGKYLLGGQESVPPLRLALLGDAHLKDGNPALPEARALARAVGEIGALKPPPDMVLLAGDVAHCGHPHALALGREILADLPAPLLAVRGEGDAPAGPASSWPDLFGPPWFSLNFRGLQLLGVHTDWRPGPHGPMFYLGEEQHRRLLRELSRFDPDLPLIILSHAPLTPLYRPWQQWTADAMLLAPHLSTFRRVLCLHGHVHHPSNRGQWPLNSDLGVEESYEFPGERPDYNKSASCITNSPWSWKAENRLTHLALPATSWSLPLPVQGTPARLRPGLAPHGCGWLLLALQPDGWTLHPHLWTK